MSEGRIARVAGPVVVAEGLDALRIYDVVRVGSLGLLGEVIRLSGGQAVVQVHEDTSGLKVGDPVESTGAPLEVELGPGLLGSIFDGIQRLLPALAFEDGSVTEPFLKRGATVPAIDRRRLWAFAPAVATGDAVGPGDVLGTVREGALIHRILVPPGTTGSVEEIAAGDIRVDEPVAVIGGEPVTMLQRWPVRRPRPFADRLDPRAPLLTGQRVIDTLYPVARGGTATIPGGFGTGKTVTEQSLAKWSDADVVIYVGCGERGNELTEVLQDFPRLEDPRTGATLMDRTILIANTSNMPVAAREASVYTGITLGEYYRDQGYDVALLADSTSRWGEALREVSGRLEEMPGEEGYPAYLPSRLAEFYERAGSVVALGADRREGSVTVVGAVSPPGGDFSEPVTQYSLRLAGTFWALDTDLARRRHFPSIHWGRSYSLYRLATWFSGNVSPEWEEQRRWALELLQRDGELQSIVQLLGGDVLAPTERVVLQTGRMIREDFLQQSAYEDVDAFCPLSKQYWMLWVIRSVHEIAEEGARRGADPAALGRLSGIGELAQMKRWPEEGFEARAKTVVEQIREEASRV